MYVHLRFFPPPSRSHLFQCATTGVPASSYTCGQHHLAWPIIGRDLITAKPRPLAILELATPPLFSLEPEQLQWLGSALGRIKLGTQ